MLDWRKVFSLRELLSGNKMLGDSLGNAKPGCTVGLGDSLGSADQCLAGLYFVLQRNEQLLVVFRLDADEGSQIWNSNISLFN